MLATQSLASVPYVQGRQNEGGDVEQQCAAKMVAVPAPEAAFGTNVVIIAIAGGRRRHRPHIVDGVVLWQHGVSPPKRLEDGGL